MKKRNIKNLSILLSITLFIGLLSCDSNDDIYQNEIIGTYTGTLSSEFSSKTFSTKETASKSATAVVSMVGDKIEVHCFNDEFDQSVLLYTYKDNDSIMVCLTGSEFENMYGHRLGEGNMNGNMGNMSTEWGRHMNEEHNSNDEHFGGFNMKMNSFGYTFRTNHGDYHFQGTKN